MNLYSRYKKQIFILWKILLEVLPMGGVLAMTLHIVFLLLGHNFKVSEYLFGYSAIGAILLFVQSYVLKFCRLYRLSILYSVLVMHCIYHQRNIGFGVALTSMRVITLIMGVILSIVIVFKMKSFVQQIIEAIRKGKQDE